MACAAKALEIFQFVRGLSPREAFQRYPVVNFCRATMHACAAVLAGVVAHLEYLLSYLFPRLPIGRVRGPFRMAISRQQQR